MIDSHTHLCDPAFDKDRHDVIKRAQSEGIEALFNICTHPEELKIGLKLHEQYPWIYNIGATTPHDVEKEGEQYFEVFATHARNGDLIAIGETGLDYYHWKESASLQQIFLHRYLQLALECDLPVVIHCREAFKDFFHILDQYPTIRGVLHCFTGTIEEANEVIARNWYLSLSGISTFKKSEALREVARQVPLNRLLIETDAPYLAPSPFRGKRNEPAYLTYTAARLAEARGISIDELVCSTKQNAYTLLRLV